jgi:hypothetical protein
VSVHGPYELAGGIISVMDAANLKLSLQNIEEYVMDEDKIVS